MDSNVLLAVDVVGGRLPCNADADAQLACELVRGAPWQVVVLYVRGFSVLRLGQMMADHGGAAGQHAVDRLVAGLRAAGWLPAAWSAKPRPGTSPGPSSTPPGRPARA